MSEVVPPTLQTTPEQSAAKHGHGRNFYMVLAGLDLAAICCLLMFNHQIVAGFLSSNTVNQGWIKRQSMYGELDAAAHQCRQPAVEVLQHKQTDKARTQLENAVSAYREQLDLARLDAQSQISESQRSGVMQRLNRLTETLHSIEREAEQVIQFVEREQFTHAEGAMPRLDLAYAEVLDQVNELSLMVRGIIHQNLEAEADHTLRMKGFQIWFAIGGVLMVGCVTFYAHRMAHAIQRSVETSRQQTNELIEKEARLRTIFDKAADGIVTMNDQGVLESCNQATLDLFRQVREDLIGKPIYLLMEPFDEAAEAKGNVSLCLLDVNSLIGTTRELRGMRPDGSRFYAEVAVAEVRFAERRVITGILHDVTDRRRIEAELKQARLDAEAATEAKSQFLANMSHEIRTPMAAIIGYADLLLEPGQSDDERFRCVDTVRRNADHLLTLINDILDISKIEAGKMTVETIKFSPCQIVGDVASLMRVRAIEKEIDFEVHYENAVPESITGDPVRVRQVLLNLVGNSIKFTKRGRVSIHAWSEGLDSDKPLMCFKVIDSGIGMTDEQLARLFRPFTQADYSTTRQFGGTGLGLTISKRLVEMMGGTVNVSSVCGLGSSFEFRIPTGNLCSVRILSTPTEVEAFRQMPHHGAMIANGRLTARVLLAEDGIDNYRLISHHLRKAGATVVHAENGQLAVEKALAAVGAQEPFDVILMDMQMPVMDGYQATGKLRSMGYQGPILALTAHAMSGDRQKCIQAGCDDFLTKPINAALLIGTVQGYARGACHLVPKAAPSIVNPEPTSRHGTDQATPDAETQFLDLAPDEEPLVSEFADDPDMAEIIAPFVAGLEERIQELDASFAANDRAQLASVSHRVKGAAGGYGYPQISTVAMEMERLCTSETSLQQIRPLLDQLVHLCRRAIAGHKPRRPATHEKENITVLTALQSTSTRSAPEKESPNSPLDQIARRIHGLVSSEPDLKVVGEILSDLAATLPSEKSADQSQPMTLQR